MIYINNELKAIFIRLPKTGGKYVASILTRFYGFRELDYTREDISDFFDSDEHLIKSLEVYSSKVYSIRKLGLLRYYLNEEHHLNEYLSQKRWDSYYKFTFINDPYIKFMNAFLHSSMRIFTDERTKDDYKNIKLFIDNRENISNLAYFTTFINQYDHLLDYNGKINMQYIGLTERIDYDIIQILKNIGITNLKHMSSNSWEDNKENKFIYNTDFYVHYDQYLLDHINELFSEDFEVFNFTKITNIDEFIEKYKNGNETVANILPKIIFEANMNNILDFEESQLIHTLKDTLVTFIENNEAIHKISDEDIFNNQYKVLFRKIFKMIGDKLDEKKKLNLCEDINTYAAKNNSTDIQNQLITCSHCNNFKSYNKIANDTHERYCLKTSIVDE